MKSYYPKIAERIVLPRGFQKRLSKRVRISIPALEKVLDGQKNSKWQFEYSFDEVRDIAISEFKGQYAGIS